MHKVMPKNRVFKDEALFIISGLTEAMTHGEDESAKEKVVDEQKAIIKKISDAMRGECTGKLIVALSFVLCGLLGEADDHMQKSPEYNLRKLIIILSEG